MTMHIDGFEVKNHEEATVLMVHHLRLAAMLFEGTHEDRGRRANELLRGLPDMVVQASSAFVEVLCTYYEGLNVADEGGDNDPGQ